MKKTISFITFLLFAIFLGAAELLELESKPIDGKKFIMKGGLEGEFAFVTIVSPLSLTFTSNLFDIKASDITRDGNEYIITVPTKMKFRLEVAATVNHAKLRIDVKAREFKNNITYAVTEKAQKLIDGKGALIIETEPSGATVTIDGNPDFSKLTPVNFENRTAMPYKFQFEMEAYNSKDTILNVNAG